MIQYTCCTDPSESAALKERMRLAEENEDADAVIRNIVAASTTALNTSMINVEEVNTIETSLAGRFNEPNDKSPLKISTPIG